MGRRVVLFSFFVLTLLLVGCGGSSDTSTFSATGTQGLVMEFVESRQTGPIVAGESFDLLLSVRNLGTYDTSGQVDGNVYFTGFDNTIITGLDGATSLNDKSLFRRSQFTPQGGVNFIEKAATTVIGNLNIDSYKPIIAATACYRYQTVLGTEACVDTNPSNDYADKPCTIQSSSVSSQGAPVAITEVIQEPLGNSKIAYTIKIKNVGGGDVINTDAESSTLICAPNNAANLKRTVFDKVKIETAKVGGTDLDCKPSETITLDRDGTATIFCTLDLAGKSQTGAFKTQLELAFEYIYRSTIQKTIEIEKPEDIGGTSVEERRKEAERIDKNDGK